MTTRPASRSHVVLGEIGAQVLGRLTGGVLSFVLLPFVIEHVGRKDYGRYVLVLSVTGYFAMLDFGMFSAVVKHVAEYRGQGDHHRVRRVVSSAFTFYTTIGPVGALGLRVAAALADRLFGLGPASAARRLLVVAAVSALVLWPTAVFRGVVEGFQRYDGAAWWKPSPRWRGRRPWWWPCSSAVASCPRCRRSPCSPSPTASTASFEASTA